MEYHGKLYGSVAGEHFDTGKTSQQYDDLLENLLRLVDRIKEDGTQDHYPSAFRRAEAAIEKALN